MDENKEIETLSESSQNQLQNSTSTYRSFRSFAVSASFDPEDVLEDKRCFSFKKIPNTRVHWKGDNEAEKCQAEFCNTTFSLVHRRHHCRKCGDIFCDKHTSKRLPLDYEAQTIEQLNVLVRVCDNCYTVLRESL
eukprot:TRINITY_DN4619_c0_g1_i1.p1 TRINITY_DN4619_c0_g1~~TRINITY_DN4619_c0_g1_i1.p1  ORF type:complete len:135 (+),score=40.53 TRINITY_DN4619_c0_g1_i1:199-603(+)